jgi:hypothetical protein
MRGSNSTHRNRNNCNISYTQNTPALQPNGFNWNKPVKVKDKGKVYHRTGYEGLEGE